MRRQAGFAYLFVLFTIALLAISAVAVATLDGYAQRRGEEAQLLQIDGEFRRALDQYYRAQSPHVYPATLGELLQDRRSGIARRYLRKIYVDPITRATTWGIVLEQGRIVGIHSLSEVQPIKVAGFEKADRDFAGAQRYADWVFRSMPRSADEIDANDR